jgi:uncharacterized integral membrane protein
MRLKSIFIVLYTIIIVIVVFSITATVLQDPFTQGTAPLQFLFWETREAPMIFFVSSAFLAGLFFGLIIVIFDNFQNRKMIKDLKKQLNEVNKTLKSS